MKTSRGLPIALAALAVFSLASCATGGASRGSTTDYASMRSADLARRVARIRGVNLGNALEAPVEGMWGVTLTEHDFATIETGGFNTVRVPVRWSAHARVDAPWRVDSDFFRRIDWVLSQAKRHHLLVILNMHHYDELFADPGANTDRFLAVWTQIAERYASVPDDELWFEPLNEPNGRLQGMLWNDVLSRALGAIRGSNPTRPIVFGGDSWNAYDSLFGVAVPDDARLVLTFHYYNPFEFTHQGAEWVSGMDRYLGTSWDGTESQRHIVNLQFNVARRASEAYGLPVLLGEFGAYSKAPMESRARWTAYVVHAAQERGFGWAYWEFRSGFGVYDGASGAWVAPLHDALFKGR